MRRFLAVLAFCCVTAFTCAQTADDLVSKNVEAKGGLEKHRAVKSIRQSGKFDLGGGFIAKVSQDNQRPNLVREEFSVQGMTAVQAFDGSTGWQIQPFQGHKDPELMGEDDLRDMQLDSDFDGALVDYKDKGNTVEFLGHDVVDGDDALRLKCTLKNGDVIYYYLDPDTYLEIRKEIQQTIRGAVRERVVDLGSYKPVNGVMYPFSIATGSKANPGAQTLTVEKVEVNIPMDNALFAVPASLKQAPKQAAENK
jgi:hypothetical protein